LLVSQHVLNDGVGFLYDFVLSQFLEAQFFSFNDGFEDVDGVTIKSRMVYHVVIRDVAN